MSINKYYIDCIKRKSNITVNQMGKAIRNFEDYAIKGYIGSQISHDVVVGGKIVVNTVHKFYTNDFDINQDDLIVYENETYEIYSTEKNTAHKSHHNKIKLKKLDGMKGG